MPLSKDGELRFCDVIRMLFGTSTEKVTATSQGSTCNHLIYFSYQYQPVQTRLREVTLANVSEQSIISWTNVGNLPHI